MLQAEADDEAQKELDKVVFSEATCLGCNKYAWAVVCRYQFGCYLLLGTLLNCAIFAKAWRNDPRPLYENDHGPKTSVRRWGDPDPETFNEVDLVQWGVFFYWSDWGLYVACALMTVTWCVCAPCALWCLRTPARGDGGSVAPA